MQLELNTLKDTIRLTSDILAKILSERDYNRIEFSFESCVNPTLTTNCPANTQQFINDTENFTVTIPMLDGLFVDQINFKYIFADREVNVLTSPIIYNNNDATFVQVLQSQVNVKLAALGLTATASFSYTTSGNQLFLTIASLPTGMIAESVRYDVGGIKKTDTFTHSISEYIFASSSHLFFKSTAIGLDKYVNDVMKIRVTVEKRDGVCISMTGCYFIDVDMTCQVSNDISKLTEGQLNTHLMLYGLDKASGCLSDCTNLCSLFKALQAEVSDDC